jgi:hypothetical protein
MPTELFAAASGPMPPPPPAPFVSTHCTFAELPAKVITGRAKPFQAPHSAILLAVPEMMLIVVNWSG